MTEPQILVVDDESTLRHVIGKLLEKQRCRVEVAGTAEAALDILAENRPDAALVDIVLPGMDGIALLGRIKQISPDTEVIIMTSHASVETAIKAMREGAYDYIQKPFRDLHEIWKTVQRALEKRELLMQNKKLLEDREARNRELEATVARLSSLIDAGRAMGSVRTLPDLLDSFVGLVAEELDVDRASLMLMDVDSGEMTIAAGRGLEDLDAESVRVRMGEGIAGGVAQNGQPFMVNDVDRDPRIGHDPDPKLGSSFISTPIVLSMPIKSQGKVLGVLNVTKRRSGEPFDEKDLAYVSGMAGQLAVAVESARHFEELQKAYEEVKSTQDQLVASERIKAVGQMAMGVAHDFNNALSVIMARAEMLKSKVRGEQFDCDRIVSDLDMIRKISVQGAETIRRIQDFTRVRKDSPRTVVDPNTIVREAIEMTRPRWKDEFEKRSLCVEIETDLAPEIGAVFGNPHELTQLVGNLIFNAVDAMPEGGRLVFRTRTDDGRVLIEVTDTGLGMSEEVRSHLFEPFFTTKPNGQGLGTSIVYGIVSRHGGDIEVQSAEDAGTTIRVSLPLAPDAAPDGPRKPAEIGSPAAASKVLVVEDDNLVRGTYQEALEAGGHSVVAVSDGRAALDALDREAFDLVITDLSMPGMSGVEVARALKVKDPSLPVALLSGWAVQQEEERLSAAGIDFVLAKPCSIPSLLNLVQRAARKLDPENAPVAP